MKKVRIMTIAIFLAIVLSNYVYGNEIDNYEKVKFKTTDTIFDTGFKSNMSIITYVTPAQSYDFFDEDGILNIVYRSDNKIYWSKYNEEEKTLYDTKDIDLFYNMNNEEKLPTLAYIFTYNFANAIYDNGYLYVLYSRMAYYENEEDRANQKVLALAKYNMEGELVKVEEYLAEHLNTRSNNPLSGTSVPFYYSNCSLAANNGVICCFFGRNMFSSHQSSFIAFFNEESLKFVNDLQGKIENEQELKLYQDYYNITQHSISHSLAQRVIATEDGKFLFAESGDSGVGGISRGLIVSKITDEYNETLDRDVYNISSRRMLHYSEGGNSARGYNNTYHTFGSLLELNDGYMYIGGLENKLSLEYGNTINGEWNIFVQKYAKDFYLKNNPQEMQLLETPLRVATGNKPEKEESGPLYLTGNEIDYGIKFLTNLNNSCAVVVRATKLSEDKIAILWDETKIEEFVDSSTGQIHGYTPSGLHDRDSFFMIIDKDGNIIKHKTSIEGAYLSLEENYVVKNGKVYWSSSTGSREIVVNILDLNNQVDDLLKGDINKDRYINSVDAAIVLDKFKSNDVTEEDFELGDMNEDNLLNSTDSAMILDIFKNM